MAEEKQNQENYIFDKKAIDVLIANIIPTSKYFESRFDHLQSQINVILDDIREIKINIKDFEKHVNDRFEAQKKEIDLRFETFKQDIDNRFKQVDNRFEQIDKRFEQIDKQFESFKQDVNKRFEQIDKRFESFKQDIDRRFEQVDKRFEQVDKRFEKIDERFENIEIKLDKILERIDTKIDAGLRENRTLTIRLFTFAMTFAAVSIIGLLGRIFNLF
ncbi:MAG: hypothetical protein KatS3mg129_2602 [Leptospiraceae bacterium]|nr:MAG: hypothetical protein KatS3mg129_2602 [Leptospiraceae bacterium]